MSIKLSNYQFIFLSFYLSTYKVKFLSVKQLCMIILRTMFGILRQKVLKQSSTSNLSQFLPYVCSHRDIQIFLRLNLQKIFFFPALLNFNHYFYHREDIMPWEFVQTKMSKLNEFKKFKMIILFQDEKNQILTTNIWLNLVS